VKYAAEIGLKNLRKETQGMIKDVESKMEDMKNSQDDWAKRTKDELEEFERMIRKQNDDYIAFKNQREEQEEEFESNMKAMMKVYRFKTIIIT
jgi:septal ring factor EnvC (AmiA/AmiB activator)